MGGPTRSGERRDRRASGHGAPGARIRRVRPAALGVGILALLGGIGFVALHREDLLLDLWYRRTVVRRVINGEPAVGMRYVRRGRAASAFDRREVLWSVRTGYRVYRARSDADGGMRSTRWNSDGTVAEQARVEVGRRWESKSSPPWWDGAEDQAEPSSPFGWGEGFRDPGTSPEG